MLVRLQMFAGSGPNGACGGRSPARDHSRLTPLSDPPPSRPVHASATAGPSTGWAVT